MSDVKKSALWALISIPISFLGYLFSWAVLHTGGVLAIPVFPALLVIWILFDPKESPEWLVWGTALIAQYLGYFIVIFILIKIIRVLKNTRSENIAKEQSAKNDSGL